MVRTRQHGLTLLEMMVVLIIAGMALALGFQSLGQWRRAEAAISALGSQVRQQALARDWLQSSLRALTPVEADPFSGTADTLHGTTLQPVFAPQGGATPIDWRIVRDGDGLHLDLGEAGGSPVPLPLPAAATAEFAYLDAEGKSHDRWPPALGQQDHLPAAILLRMNEPDGRTRLWGARIVGIRNPVPVFYERDQDY